MKVKRILGARTFRLGVAALLVAWCVTARVFHLHFLAVPGEVTRVAAAHTLAWSFRSDLDGMRALCEGYLVGQPDQAWETTGRKNPGEGAWSPTSISRSVPFVYESPGAPYLEDLRERYRLRELTTGARDEYEAMIRLGAWLGTRWDHGSDPVPGGIQEPRPVEVIRAGENGARFWCEVAAKVTVQAATSLGWPARVVTASRNGYRWEHGAAELWSNQFGKWFVLDTDFNLVHERDGVPLSAFELCHQGPALQRAGALTVRRIAPRKASLKDQDLLPFYEYVHIDMRNDWCSRRLRRGSPASGDLATWWTARASLGPVLTARVRVDDAARFDWPVNMTAIGPVTCLPAEGMYESSGALSAYCPYFDRFEISMDGGPWEEAVEGKVARRLAPGDHSIRARVVVPGGHRGPIREARFTAR